MTCNHADAEGLDWLREIPLASRAGIAPAAALPLPDRVEDAAMLGASTDPEIRNEGGRNEGPREKLAEVR